MALDMFLNMGSKIPGESQDSKLKNSIDILSWNWGGSSNASFESGGGGATGKANFSDLTITKFLDKASAPLLIALAKGTHIPSCVLTVRKGGDGQANYIVITLTKAMVTGVSHGGGMGEDRMTENLRLSYAEIKFEYFMQSATGTVASAGVFDYDIAANLSK